MNHKISPGVSRLLNRLGLSASYLGYYYIAYGLFLIQQQPDRLLLVTKWLYPDIAKYYHTRWTCVERNLRAAISIIWTNNPGLLEQLAGYPLHHKPGTAQFLGILYAHLCHAQAA